MSIVAILIAGTLAGLLAAYIMRQKTVGMLGYLLVSLIGSFVGGFFFGNHLSITPSVFVNVLITSTIGAVIFLLGIALFTHTECRTDKVWTSAVFIWQRIRKTSLIITTTFN
jgi:uncharacterized membrane protein YeaQ/YmgE (transglycosylase-associated protein family)